RLPPRPGRAGRPQRRGRGCLGRHRHVPRVRRHPLPRRHRHRRPPAGGPAVPGLLRLREHQGARREQAAVAGGAVPHREVRPCPPSDAGAHDQAPDAFASPASLTQDDGREADRRELLTFSWERLPFVTAEVDGTGGTIRERPEDFVVEEQPLYLPEGRGSHLYLLVEKRSLTTRDLITALMGQGVSEASIGVAGLKDKHALTTQWLSLPK